MTRTETLHTVRGTFVHEAPSGKAFLFIVSHVDTRPMDHCIRTWFPYSQIVKLVRDPINTDEDYFTCKSWIIEQKKLTCGPELDMEREKESPPATNAPIFRKRPPLQMFDDVDDDIPF